jgi:hypothetical protein
LLDLRPGFFEGGSSMVLRGVPRLLITEVYLEEGRYNSMKIINVNYFAGGLVAATFDTRGGYGTIL